MNRRKLEAEAVRDAILAVGRQARPHDGRARASATSWSSSRSTRRTTSTTSTTPTTRGSHRRAVYRFLVRSQAAAVHGGARLRRPVDAGGQRNETVTPLQAPGPDNNALHADDGRPPGRAGASAGRADRPSAGGRRVPAGGRRARRRRSARPWPTTPGARPGERLPGDPEPE